MSVCYSITIYDGAFWLYSVTARNFLFVQFLSRLVIVIFLVEGLKGDLACLSLLC